MRRVIICFTVCLKKVFCNNRITVFDTHKSVPYAFSYVPNIVASMGFSCLH